MLLSLNSKNAGSKSSSKFRASTAFVAAASVASFSKISRRLQSPTGPYYVLQGYIQGQKFSERLPAGPAQPLEPLIANYKRFEELAEEFVTVTDQITRLSQSAPEAKKTPDRDRARTLPRSQPLHPTRQSQWQAPGTQSGRSSNCLFSNTISGPIPVMYAAVDGTGVPMGPEALEGRAGKQLDGSAKTREIKLGCIFTQTHQR